MRLNRLCAYALAALAHLARRAGGPVPSHVIAGAAALPEEFLRKALKRLARAGVLLAVQGPNGGYALARPAKHIALLEVVELVDGPVRGEAPAVGRGGDAAALNRRLQGACDQAAELVRRRLGKVTVAELAKEG
jgi:Rrf2 family protein